MTRRQSRLRAGVGPLLLLIALLPAPAAARPINGRELMQPAPGAGYTFWIVGHSYGRSVYPASSLASSVGMLNESGALGMVLLGDALRYPTDFHIEILRSLVDRIEIPVFLAPGNHELRDADRFAAHFGPTYYDFRIARDLYLVFEASLYGGALPAAQLDYFRDTLARAADDPSVRNIVILCHQLLWAVDDPRLEAVRDQLNFPPDYRSGFFTAEIEPAVLAAAERKPVWFISGDRSGFPPLYFEVPGTSLTYVATGLKDDENDGILELRSAPDGDLHLRLVSLSRRDLGPLERYGPAYWKTYFEGEGVRALLLPRPADLAWTQSWLFVSSSRFRWGAAAGAGAALAGVALVWLARRRRSA